MKEVLDHVEVLNKIPTHSGSGTFVNPKPKVYLNLYVKNEKI
jgi:hypothetical protein